MSASEINWDQFPQNEPAATPHEVSQIVSDKADRQYIYSRQFSLQLLANEELSWTPSDVEKLTEKGRIEVRRWLQKKEEQRAKGKRKITEKPCVGCKEQNRGFPGQLHSKFCSEACKKLYRKPLNQDRPGPVRAGGPDLITNSIAPSISSSPFCLLSTSHDLSTSSIPVGDAPAASTASSISSTSSSLIDGVNDDLPSIISSSSSHQSSIPVGNDTSTSSSSSTSSTSLSSSLIDGVTDDLPSTSSSFSSHQSLSLIHI